MTNPALEGDSSVVVPLHSRERHAPGEELDSFGADSWEAWSAAVTTEVLPMLGELSHSLPGLRSALLSTADGFGLCAVGLDEATMRRVSSMASSMTSLASAATDSAPSVGTSPAHSAGEPLPEPGEALHLRVPPRPVSPPRPRTGC